MANKERLKDVLLVLTDLWADWEAAYAVAEVHSSAQYVVKTVAVDRTPKCSIGGIRAEIDDTIGSYRNFDNLALVILPGGYSWKEDRHEEIAAFVRKAREHRVPIAAICGATIFLGKHGFLDVVKHTGDDLSYFKAEQGYNGQANYVSAQVVVDQGFITANETAAVDFAYEIFKLLDIDTAEALDLWHNTYKHGAIR